MAFVLHERRAVTWYTWLIVAALITAVAAVTGLTPTGGRPVARTGLMSVARMVLLLIIVICTYLAYRAGAGN
jgi:hypothetical protein